MTKDKLREINHIQSDIEWLEKFNEGCETFYKKGARFTGGLHINANDLSDDNILKSLAKVLYDESEKQLSALKEKFEQI